MNKRNEMTKYLKKNRKLDQKKMISARIRTHVIEAFQNASDEANKNGYSLSLASVIEEALEYSIAEYTEVSGKDFLQHTASGKRLDEADLKKYAPNIVDGVFALKEWSNSL